MKQILAQEPSMAPYCLQGVRVGGKILLFPRDYRAVSLGFQCGLSSIREAPIPILSITASQSPELRCMLEQVVAEEILAG